MAFFTQDLVSGAPDRTPQAWELLGTAGAFFGIKTTPAAFWDRGCDRVSVPTPNNTPQSLVAYIAAWIVVIEPIIDDIHEFTNDG
jgi:hypothetical protein